MTERDDPISSGWGRWRIDKWTLTIKFNCHQWCRMTTAPKLWHDVIVASCSEMNMDDASTHFSKSIWKDEWNRHCLLIIVHHPNRRRKSERIAFSIGCQFWWRSTPKERLNGKKNTMHVNRQSNSIKSPLNINIPCEEMQTSKENRKRERHVLMHAKGMDERTIVYFHTHTHKNTKGKEDPSYHIANMKTVNFTKNTHAA